ncbi:MAG: cyclic nucleotide-binding domain-containing protein [Deltaproteobacteria bacterium]
MDRRLRDLLGPALNLEAKDLDLLAGFLIYKKLNPGEALFKEGESGDFAAFILDGVVQVKKETEFPGKYFVLAILSRGEAVGEFPLTNGRTPIYRSASVEALKKTELAILGKKEFDSLCIGHPQIAVRLLRRLLEYACLRLQGANQRMAAVF